MPYNPDPRPSDYRVIVLINDRATSRENHVVDKVEVTATSRSEAIAKAVRLLGVLDEPTPST